MHPALFDVDAFLKDHWQKKPLLIRNPWGGGWTNPLAPDELAGLACEDGVESRLIVQSTKAARDRWKVEHGPVAETRFGKLGKKPWTLLVQAVDHQVPDVAALIAPFRFMPNWRIDDVMVSYATDGGGVGPHFDQYDVFLIQGLGQRRWQVGGLCTADTALLPHDDLRLLADFQASDEWVLDPGDILYVPPRFAHNGVAVGDDCMTYSIGFRAPSRSELIAHWCDDVLSRLDDDDRYQDSAAGPVQTAADNPGELSPASLEALHSMITQKLADRAAFANWFGRYNSTPKYPDTDWQPDSPVDRDDVREWLGDNVPLHRNPASRFSFIQTQDDAITLFVDGESITCADETAGLGRAVCSDAVISVTSDWLASDAAMDLIATLINGGSLAFAGDD